MADEARASCILKCSKNKEDMPKGKRSHPEETNKNRNNNTLNTKKSMNSYLHKLMINGEKRKVIPYKKMANNKYTKNEDKTAIW